MVIAPLEYPDTELLRTRYNGARARPEVRGRVKVGNYRANGFTEVAPRPSRSFSNAATVSSTSIQVRTTTPRRWRTASHYVVSDVGRNAARADGSKFRWFPGDDDPSQTTVRLKVMRGCGRVEGATAYRSVVAWLITVYHRNKPRYRDCTARDYSVGVLLQSQL